VAFISWFSLLVREQNPINHQLINSSTYYTPCTQCLFILRRWRQ